MSCSLSNYCTSCKIGYFVESEDSGVTQICSQCPENCVNCESGNFCDECESGLVWFTTLNECVECLLGCSFCNSDNIT